MGGNVEAVIRIVLRIFTLRLANHVRVYIAIFTSTFQAIAGVGEAGPDIDNELMRVGLGAGSNLTRP